VAVCRKIGIKCGNAALGEVFSGVKGQGGDAENATIHPHLRPRTRWTGGNPLIVNGATMIYRDHPELICHADAVWPNAAALL